MKTLFVVSDIHGDYDALTNGLREAKYDENNESHLLIVIGDLFDRGTQSKEVYEYLRRLTDEGKAIVTRGNHDLMFQDYLEGGDCLFNFSHNGFDKTLDSFLERTRAFESYMLIDLHMMDAGYEDIEKCFSQFQNNSRKLILQEYKGIKEWLNDLPDYYETENYIFTHGCIDTKAKDWHFPEKMHYDYEGWNACHWTDSDFFGKKIKNTNKTVVVGHWHTDVIRERYGLKYDGTNKILVRDDGQIIMIDTCTPITHKVNVLIINDEKLL